MCSLFLQLAGLLMCSRFCLCSGKPEDSIPPSSAAVIATGITNAATAPEIPATAPSAPAAPAVAAAPETEPSVVATVVENENTATAPADEPGQPAAPVVQEQIAEVVTNSVEEPPKQESLE